MKFYDKGFVNKFDDYTQVQIFSAGTVILNLRIFENQICRDTFACQSLKSFNNDYLDKSYDEKFLKDLFDRDEKEITHRDRKNKILIKIKKD